MLTLFGLPVSARHLKTSGSSTILSDRDNNNLANHKAPRTARTAPATAQQTQLKQADELAVDFVQKMGKISGLTGPGRPWRG